MDVSAIGREKRMGIKGRIAILSSLLVVALPSAAMAQITPTEDAYTPGGQEEGPPPERAVQESPGETGGPAPTSENRQVETSESDLPFTGLELGIFALAGAALLGSGLAIRRLARAQTR
jgi:hypothetical protein